MTSVLIRNGEEIERGGCHVKTQRQRETRPHEDGGRDRSDVATRQGMTWAVRRWKRKGSLISLRLQWEDGPTYTSTWNF